MTFPERSKPGDSGARSKGRHGLRCGLFRQTFARGACAAGRTLARLDETGHARQETRCLVLPLTLPSSYPGALPAPGAEPPPTSSIASTACCRTPLTPQTTKFAVARYRIRGVAQRVVQGVATPNAAYNGPFFTVMPSRTMHHHLAAKNGDNSSGELKS
jgi:hypothetical protein